jgi:hypothetical protein
MHHTQTSERHRETTGITFFFSEGIHGQTIGQVEIQMKLTIFILSPSFWAKEVLLIIYQLNNKTSAIFQHKLSCVPIFSLLLIITFS